MLINPLYQPVAGHDFADLIADYPLGIIVGSELVATHMPMLAVREPDGSVVVESHIPWQIRCTRFWPRAGRCC